MKLADFCDVIMGQAPAGENYNDTGEGYPLLAGAGDLGDSFPQAKRFSKTAAKLNQVGDIILCIRATIGNKNWADKIYCLGRGVAAIRAKNDKKTDIRYIWHWLTANNENLLKKAKGATFKQVTKQDIEELPCELPPLSEQKRIAAILDKVDGIIRKRKQSMRLLDELVKAKFVEMFGDPIMNEMGWPIYKLKELTIKIGSGATPSGGRVNYVKKGISLIRSMNVYDGQFHREGLAYITSEQAKILNNVEVTVKDVLINITGASVTRSCLAPSDILPARVNQHVSIIRCNFERLNPYFINSLFTNYNFKQYLLLKASQAGATRDALTKEILGLLSIPLPPLDMQEKFALHYSQKKEFESKIFSYIEEVELLKDSLTHKYFTSFL